MNDALVQNAGPPPALDELQRRYLARRLRFHPAEAELHGLPGYEDTLGPEAAEEIADYAQFLEQMRRACEALTLDHEEEQFRRDALLHLLAEERFVLTRFEQHRRDPGYWLRPLGLALWLPLARPAMDPEWRLVVLRRRLAHLPRHLASVRSFWTPCAASLLDTGESFLDGIKALLGGWIKELAEQAPAALAREIDQHRLAALAAIEETRQVIRGLRPQAVAACACGRELFEAYYAEVHQFPHLAAEIIEAGRQDMERSRKRLRQLAGRLKHGSDPWELAENYRGEHPTAAGLLDAYRREIQRARAFVSDRRLASIPPAVEPEVLETPDFLRCIWPFVAYVPAPAFARFAEQTGLLLVTGPDPQAAKAQQEETLRGHSWIDLPAVACHETYPGHHLQHCHTAATGDLLLLLADSPMTVEGWALYCEKLMADEGFYQDVRILFGQELNMLLRAARMVVDPGLHTGTMDQESAVDFLVKEVGLERQHAVAEVRRYICEPTRASSYRLGKWEFRKLRRDWDMKHPGSHLGEFHDRVMSCGGIPLPLIRRRLALDNSGQAD